MKTTIKFASTLLMIVMIGALAFAISAQETISIGETVTGEITDGEAVEYVFEAKAGDSIVIDLQGEFDTYLYLLDAEGNELERNDDGGEGTNSRIRGFVIPEDGTYTIQADSFSDTDSGAFTLTLDDFNFTEIAIGESATGQFEEGVSDIYFALEGNNGDVLDFVVDSGNTLDTKMEIIHPYDYSVGESLDGDGTVDPSMMSVVLDTQGTYFIVISPQNPNATLNGEFTLTVTGAELDSLDSGPLDLTFDFDVNESVFTFEGTAGEVVRLTVTLENASEFASPRFVFTQEGEEFANFSMRGVSQMITDMEIPNDGSVTVSVTAYSEVNINIALGRPLE